MIVSLLAIDDSLDDISDKGHLAFTKPFRDMFTATTDSLIHTYSTFSHFLIKVCEIHDSVNADHSTEGMFHRHINSLVTIIAVGVKSKAKSSFVFSFSTDNSCSLKECLKLYWNPENINKDCGW